MSTFNPWKELQGLIGGPPLQAGVVLSITEGTAVVELPGGAQVQARGVAEPGQTVYLRGDVIEGEAGNLPIEVIDI